MSFVKGDYIFLAWEKGANEKYQEKKKELESLGYKFKEHEDDYLNRYYIYENVDGDNKIITVCCM